MDYIFNKGFYIGLLTGDDIVQKIIYGKSNYYSLHSNSYYSIKLGNSHNVRVDAHIWIDNKKIGIFRINPNSSIVVSRDNYGNQLIMMKHQNFKKGLIKVVFIPEKYIQNYEYTNPTRNTKPDVDIYRWNCYNNYTDGVTPSNANNRRCIRDALDYEINWRPIYGEELRDILQPNYGKEKRYNYGAEINKNNIDTKNIATIYAQLFINDDFSYYKQPYVETVRDDKTNPEIIPPDVTFTLKKMARHRCPSYYNRSYESESETCSNHLTVNGDYSLPAYGRYTNGVFGGPSYNSWTLGTAAPIYINKNLYRDNYYV